MRLHSSDLCVLFKLIKKKLITAVEKVMTDNNVGLLSKIEKDLKKSIKEISGKAVKATA